MRANYNLHPTRRRWAKILLIIASVLLILMITSVVVVRRTYLENLKPASLSQKSQLVTVPLNSSVNQIATLLQKNGIIKSSWAFEWYVRSQEVGSKLQAGSYSLKANQSVQDIVTALTNGKIATDLVTILPGQRLDQVRQALINAGFKTADVDAALNPDLYKDHPALVDKPAGANLEGYLYPDSYQKVAETKPETIIRQSLDQMQKHLTPDIRAGFVKQGLTVHQGVIVASIVEQEVSKQSDRAQVAQVFLSRLKQSMQLGSDITAFYGAIIAGQKPSVAYDSPYNTRLHDGLPPGPVSNVSGNSLQAVANPASTDYLYFVAGDDGITYFSHTEQEHEALTAQHCKKLCGAE